MIDLKEDTTPNGDVLLYTDNPDLKLLNELVLGVGDIWQNTIYAKA